MSKDWSPTSLFEVFGDDLVREILVMASEHPVSAEGIAEYAEASLPTIYRRLDTLEELDLLEEQMHVDSDGNQYRQFETTLKQISFEIDDGGFNVDIQLRRNLSDRFQAFWEELEQASHVDDDAPVTAGEESKGGSKHG